MVRLWKKKLLNLPNLLNWTNSGPLIVGWKNEECLHTWNNCTLEGEVYIPTILLRYKLNDIFNVDENGFFYNTLPTLPREKLCTLMMIFAKMKNKAKLGWLVWLQEMLQEKKTAKVYNWKVFLTALFYKWKKSTLSYHSQQKIWMDANMLIEGFKICEGRLELKMRRLPWSPTSILLMIFLPSNTKSKTQPVHRALFKYWKSFSVIQ